MESTTAEQTSSPEKKPTSSENGRVGRAQAVSGVSIPLETIENVIQVARQLVADNGTGKTFSKEEIAKAANRSPNLSQYYSTFVQYGIFNVVHGKGYIPTELFRKYMNPHFDNDERKYMLEMFKKPSLYTKIIETQNGHVLPPDPKKFGNMLKDEPYNVAEYAAERAARIFAENARNLGLLDINNTFRIDGSAPQQNHPPKAEKEDEKRTIIYTPFEAKSNLFELPIPLSKTRIAYLKYPLENLTKRDIRVIRKAIDFIESSIIDDEDDDILGPAPDSAKA